MPRVLTLLLAVCVLKCTAAACTLDYTVSFMCMVEEYQNTAPEAECVDENVKLTWRFETGHDGQSCVVASYKGPDNCPQGEMMKVNKFQAGEMGKSGGTMTACTCGARVRRPLFFHRPC